MAYPTLADVQSYLGFNDPSDAARLTAIITWTKELIHAYLGRNLDDGSYTQNLYNPKTELVQLDNYPVSAITSITVDGEAKTVSDYDLETDTGTIHGDLTNGDVVVIVYDGGYATLPSLVEDVFYAIVEDRYNDYKGINDSDVKDVTLFDFAKVSYDQSGSSSRSLTYTGVGSSGNTPGPLQEYLGMLDFYKSNVAIINVAGIR